MSINTELNRNTLTEKQLSKLEELLTLLSEKNPFFGEVLSNNDINIKSLETDFQKLPLITKNMIREAYESYITELDGVSKLEELTSGSTGSPLKCYKTKEERLRASLILWSERRKHDKQVNLENFFPIVGMATFNRVGDFCDFSLENMQKCFNTLNKISPKWITGPVTAIYRYARLIEKGLVNYDGSIEFIELAGEYVTPEQKSYIEKTLNSRCLNQYGTRECWCIAYECTSGHLHVVDDIYVETVNHNENIEINGKNPGELTITSLYNKLMPFIRYNIGDLGIVEQKMCECGRRSQIITLAGGRSGETIKGKREILGDIFFKRAVNDLIEAGYDVINSFRVEQKAITEFDFFIVKDNIFPDEALDFLTETIKKGLGSETKINFIFADEITSLSSGKSKTFKSLV